ncbi:hypothetical protein BRC74_00310, partial [Halobacteriales archaeon QH_7_68_42]
PLTIMCGGSPPSVNPFSVAGPATRSADDAIPALSRSQRHRQITVTAVRRGASGSRRRDSGPQRRGSPQPARVVRKPVVFRDCAMSYRLFGEAASIQAALERVPDAMDVDIEAVGTLRGAREATHADVAERLGCAPGTASEHLRKAEAKLVDAACGAPPG